jgi:beta-aspartyl-peptidase (threonine type)
MTVHSAAPFGEAPQTGTCLLVHGGAWNIPDACCEEHLDGLRKAVARGRAMLSESAAAIDVVAAVVAEMEAHGAFDAGRGAVLNRAGEVELDAGMMDGETLAYGAVAGVQRLAHPIHVARHLLQHGEGQVRLLIGEGAVRWAEEAGMPLVDNEALVCERERARFARLQREAARYHTSHAFLPDVRREPTGTVGCVARDGHGRLAAATSTGGTAFRPPGRVGDSPLPGAGYYAAEGGAASATGWGEAIAAVLLCGWAVERLAAGDLPEAAARAGLERMAARIHNRDGAGAAGGLILLDRQGRGAWAYTTPRMARAGWQEGGAAWATV